MNCHIIISSFKTLKFLKLTGGYSVICTTPDLKSDFSPLKLAEARFSEFVPVQLINRKDTGGIWYFKVRF